MMRTRTLVIGAAMAAALGLSAQEPQAPSVTVDPFWPQPLPNHWLFGSITGVAVDAGNHVWTVHRGAASMTLRTEIGLAADPPTAETCCLPAPFVLRFDPAGKLVAHWGGPGKGYDWPQSPGGLAVGADGHVWIAAAGPADPLPGARGRGGRGGGDQAAPPADAHVLEFTSDGQFVKQIGTAGKVGDSNSTTAMHRPTAVALDSGELYVADGVVNRRIVVFDAATGAYKRHWGAYGGKPHDGDLPAYDPSAPPAKQFRVPSCVALSADGLVYVCDRGNNRVQVFRKDGTFVKEAFVAKETRGFGSVWDVAFSSDAQQRFVYVADGSNQKVWVLDRESLAPVTSFGRGGRWPGQFYGVGSVATDSAGNVYTGETFEGKRLQKFAFKGLEKPGTKERP